MSVIGERQVIIASRFIIIVENLFPVTIAKLVVVARFIEEHRPTISPTMVLVTEAATKSIGNIIIIVVTLALELLG
ncbi:MAG: hypothetical protein EZS28_043362 [Streblomastix strix]|uniref:Uncharacterized protein n=1 Tax=Streblomastix strix TaxID=222440 RepID=A0A5J4TT63_9EUKA|nr:MAG: hypothetical protein EZS28_043362 [Streblomastix strix]